MKIRWYGHAAFRLVAADGLVVVTDPYTPKTAGYPPIPDPADLVIVSSPGDSFHDRHDLVPGDPVVLDALELARSGGSRVLRIGSSRVPVAAIETMEMTDHPDHPPEANAMVRFELDGIVVAHMGDVGNPLDEAQTAFLEDTDVLLALAGGPPTIALDALMAVVERVRPRLIVPMHFRTLTFKPRTMHWIEAFLSRFDDAVVDFACATEVELTRADLPDATRVLVLDYVRGA